MRSKLVILLSLVACKGGDDASSTTQTANPSAAERASGGPQVEAAEPLPASFPLPESPTRKLVRASSKLGTVVWEYEYADLAMDAATTRLESALTAGGYNITSSATEGETRTVWVNHEDRTYAIETRPTATGTAIAIRSFPDNGPATLPPPESYPAKFPFVAGGTASNAPDGSRLRIAYQSSPKDIELAMVLAARHAGWACQGSGSVTCTKDGTSVTFMAEPAAGGSVLVVTTR